jgi:hypothetical protein
LTTPCAACVGGCGGGRVERGTVDVAQDALVAGTEVKEVRGLDGRVVAAGDADLVVVGVEVDVDVEADLLEEVLVDEQEAGLDVDLHRPLLADLAEQALHLAVVLGRVADDQAAVELLDEARVAAVGLPALEVDVVLDDVDDLIDALLAVALLVVLALGVAAERALPAAAALVALEHRLQVDLGCVLVVGHLDQQVADVVDHERGVAAELLVRGDLHDAVLDRPVRPARAGR